MVDFEKDQSKIPGGLAGGKASAQRPREDREESARKAAETRHRNMVGPGSPAEAGQQQDYTQELQGNTWAVERDGRGIKAQIAAADEEADAVNRARDRDDADYDPNNPAEEELKA